MKLAQEAAIECISERGDDLHARVRVKAGARSDGLLDTRAGRILLQVRSTAKEGIASFSKKRAAELIGRQL